MFKILPNYLPVICIFIGFTASINGSTSVTTQPTPFEGQRPRTVTDADGDVHLIFHQKGNIYYSKKSTGASEFSDPIQVNSIDGSAAVGDLAVGAGGRVHVLFHGNIFYVREQVKLEDRKLQASDIRYAFYARLNEGGDVFEEQRNIHGGVWGFDGGCTISADDRGNVYAFFAGTVREGNETVRQVFLTKSTDHGASFSNPSPIDLGKGVCACCHLESHLSSDGTLRLAYRVAEESVQRDSFVLTSADGGETFQSTPLDQWELRACPGSMYSITERHGTALVSLRNQDEIFLKWEGSNDMFQPPGKEMKRRAAVVQSNRKGEVLVAWCEGENFNKPHELRWQLYDSEGRPSGEIGIEEDAFSRWGLPAIYTKPSGDFVVLH